MVRLYRANPHNSSPSSYAARMLSVVEPILTSETSDADSNTDSTYSKSSRSETFPVLQLCATADVTIALGKKHKAQAIKIDSRIVRAVSPALYKLIASHLDLHNRKRLKIADSDPGSIKNVLYLMHHQSRSIVIRRQKEFINLLITCKKYGCAEAFAAYFIAEVLQQEKKYNKPEIFVISTLIDDKAMFNKVAEDIVRMPRSRFTSNCSAALQDHIPEGALNLISHLRKNVWHQYQLFAHVFPKALPHGPTEACKNMKLLLYNYWQEIYDTRLLPADPDDDACEVPDMHQLLKLKIQPLVDAADKKCEKDWHFSGGATPNHGRLTDIFHTALETISIGTKGKLKICFDCFQSGQHKVVLLANCEEHA